MTKNIWLNSTKQLSGFPEWSESLKQVLTLTHRVNFFKISKFNFFKISNFNFFKISK